MVFQIDTIPDGPRKLTQAVLQITTMLGLYQAELARVLGVKCGDNGQLANGTHCLCQETEAWSQARLLVRCYQLLFVRMKGNEVAMRHWLRISDKRLAAVPHLLMVDDHRLRDVVACLESDVGW